MADAFMLLIDRAACPIAAAMLPESPAESVSHMRGCQCDTSSDVQCTIVDPATSERMPQYVDFLVEARKKKHLTSDQVEFGYHVFV